MIEKLVRNLSSISYISVLQGKQGTQVSIQKYRGDKKGQLITKHFESNGDDKLDNSSVEWIGSYKNSERMNYTSSLLLSSEQLVVSHCGNVDFCVDETWGLNIPRDVLDKEVNKLSDVGIDYIFSIYTVLYYWAKENVELEGVTFICLNLDDNIVTFCLENGVPVFGKIIEKTLTTSNEKSLIKFIIESIEEYYKTQNSNFVNRVIISSSISEDSVKELEDNLLLPCEVVSIDIVDCMGKISFEESK